MPFARFEIFCIDLVVFFNPLNELDMVFMLFDKFDKPVVSNLFSALRFLVTFAKFTALMLFNACIALPSCFVPTAKLAKPFPSILLIEVESLSILPTSLSIASFALVAFAFISICNSSILAGITPPLFLEIKKATICLADIKLPD